jgi:hypothetical protein
MEKERRKMRQAEMANWKRKEGEWEKQKRKIRNE